MIVLASLKPPARNLREQSSIRGHCYSVTTPATIANFRLSLQVEQIVRMLLYIVCFTIR